MGSHVLLCYSMCYSNMGCTIFAWRQTCILFSCMELLLFHCKASSDSSIRCTQQYHACTSGMLKICCTMGACGADLLISLAVHVVPDNEKHVKTWQQGIRKVDVLVCRHGRVIIAIQRICSCHYWATGIQLGLNACFSNCHCLLFHHLVSITAGSQCQATVTTYRTAATTEQWAFSRVSMLALTVFFICSMTCSAQQQVFEVTTTCGL